MKNNRLSGLSSFGYLGTNAAQPPNVITYTRAPNQNDTNYAIGDFWIHVKNPVANDSDLYVLMGLAGGIADWDLLSSGNGALTSLTGNIGGAVLPNVNGNINFLTTNTNVLVSGNPATNTLTLNFAPNTNLGLGSSFSFLTSGIGNVAAGIDSLRDISSGTRNSCFGSYAGRQLDTGSGNIAMGHVSLTQLTSGQLNVAVGRSSGELLQTGSFNILIGYNSGRALTTGGSNIIIGSNLQPALNSESNTIRIGKDGTGDELQNRCFIAGIRGVTTGVADAVAVLIDSAHQLGTVSSSEKYKQDIRPLGNLSEIIYKLEPKFFHYKKHPEIPAWGLIAEEVDKVFPQLCVYNDEAKPETVKYHDLVPLLLNEIIRLNKRLTILEEGNSCC